MANLVTVEELKDYMDITFSNTQEDAASYVLDGLESELEAYLNRPITERVFTESKRVPREARQLPHTAFFDQRSGTSHSALQAATPPWIWYLKNSPIVSVSSVTLYSADGSASTSLAYNDDYVIHPFGIEVFNVREYENITISYTAGLDGDNIPMMKIVLLRAATREMQNMHDDVVGVKDLETRNVAPLDTGFLESELRSLRRHRRVQH